MRKRPHPELIDFPQTWARIWRFMNQPGTSAASVCQGNIYFFFSLLWIWIWQSTNHWEHVLFMLCQKLQHASRFLLVILTLFVITLCILWRKPQCVLFVMGARGWGRCVFNYHLLEWLMVRQSSTELHLCMCMCVFSSVCDHVCLCAGLHVQTPLCMFACACWHIGFYVIMWLVTFLVCLHTTSTVTETLQQNKPNSTILLATGQTKRNDQCIELSLLKLPNDPQESSPKHFVVQQSDQNPMKDMKPKPQISSL